MKSFKYIPLLILFLIIYLPGNSQERYQANWKSLSKHPTPDWFRDAKFGIFIHWGIYSVPGYGSEWYPREMYIPGTETQKHHLATYGSLEKFGYKDFIPLFKAEKFDPEAWVNLFKKAGAKYIVPVAEHHDGFAMYKTSLSPWNAFTMGPKRDIVGDLAKEIKKQGLILGLSSHRIEHWWFFNGGKHVPSDVLQSENDFYYGPAMEENQTPSPEFMNDWLMRDMELVNNYEPQLVWFDWWIEQPAMDPYRKSFAAFYYNKALDWNKGVVLNYKNIAYPEGAAVLDLERGKLGSIRTLAWQTDDAIGNNSWGYTQNNTFKDARYVITNLIDIVSKNGNLLLNIGPKSDGTLTEPETQVLLGTGAWLDINGEAIYGTRPWKIFGEGPTPSASGSFVDQKQPFTWKDVRFTTLGDILFIMAFGNPDGDLKIKSLSLSSEPQIKEITLLGSQDRVYWTQNKNELLIKPLSHYPHPTAVAFKVIFKELMK